MSEMNPAQVIARQIGNGTFFMLGARGTLASGDEGRTLYFKIKGCPKINACAVTLASDDTYTVKFRKIGNARSGYRCTEVATIEGLHADQLHRTIERNTGLATSL